jgi:hypothetical protein
LKANGSAATERRSVPAATEGIVAPYRSNKVPTGLKVAPKLNITWKRYAMAAAYAAPVAKSEAVTLKAQIEENSGAGAQQI